MLEFEPEIEDSMKARFNEALEPIYDVEKIAAGKQKTPGSFRKHVFDFFDGTRIIVSKERCGIFCTTHFSMSVRDKGNFESECLHEIIQYALEHVQSICPEPLEGQVDVVCNHGIVHMMRRDHANPKWN